MYKNVYACIESIHYAYYFYSLGYYESQIKSRAFD